MAIELAALPYSHDALEPHLSAETIEYHYGKHHQKYVDTLNDLIQGTDFASQTLEQIVGNAGDGEVFNNAAQVWNHNFYWQCLAPEGGEPPSGPLAEAVDANFGSYRQFRSDFEQAATDLFGSGWVWLIDDGAGGLSIMTTKDADNPLSHGRIALLTCDVWEHAYYIDYRNERAKYLEAYWKVVNWKFAEQRFVAT